jgi:hypothetical protein
MWTTSGMEKRVKEGTWANEAAMSLSARPPGVNKLCVCPAALIAAPAAGITGYGMVQCRPCAVPCYAVVAVD